LQIYLPTVFGERALTLHILKLQGRPRQGPLSVLGKVSTASLPQKNTLFRCTYGVNKDNFCIMQIF